MQAGQTLTHLHSFAHSETLPHSGQKLVQHAALMQHGCRSCTAVHCPQALVTFCRQIRATGVKVIPDAS